jgi:nitrogen fixation NifU-like protein
VINVRYSENTLKYYEKMKNVGAFEETLPNVGTGIVGSPLCGDVMRLQLFFDENDIIMDAKYKVFGCVSAIASMELATTILKGKSIEEAMKIQNEEVADSLELTDIKRHCSVLAKEAIEAAINDYLSKKTGEKNMITVTDSAAQKLQELLIEHNSIGIAISVDLGGCSGAEYALAYQTEEPCAEDITSTTAAGIKFFYSSENRSFVNGMNIDLMENSFGHGFVISNKNFSPCQGCTCGRQNDCQT